MADNGTQRPAHRAAADVKRWRRCATECFHAMSRTILGVPLMVAVIVVSAACSRGNGLPADIRSHLADRGITIRPSRAHAPLSRRDGYVVTPYDPQTAANIIAVFGLETIQPDASPWRLALERAGGVASPKELWGVSGRPSQLKLKNGDQFEYLYLLVTTDGWMYLLAEYAYG